MSAPGSAKYDAVQEAKRNQAEGSFFADLAITLSGGDIRCALPSAFVTDESTVRTCSVLPAALAALALLVVWTLFYLMYRRTLFQAMNTWAKVGVWSLAVALAYGAYAVVRWTQVFSWRQGQLFQSIVLNVPDSRAQFGPYMQWQGSNLGTMSLISIVVGIGVLLCVIVALVVSPATARSAWAELVQRDVARYGSSRSGLSGDEVAKPAP